MSVEGAVENGLFVITGGPGTGKTTVIKNILNVFENKGFSISLAAPTGKAAKRLSESTGREASTIHRLLGFKPQGDNIDDDVNVQFEYNEQNQLETDVIIIDEMSMVDLSIMYSLIKAVNVGTRLVLVGDADQLPSVGAGNILSDIIKSECLPIDNASRSAWLYPLDRAFFSLIGTGTMASIFQPVISALHSFHIFFANVSASHFWFSYLNWYIVLFKNSLYSNAEMCRSYK